MDSILRRRPGERDIRRDSCSTDETAADDPEDSIEPSAVEVGLSVLEACDNFCRKSVKENLRLVCLGSERAGVGYAASLVGLRAGKGGSGFSGDSGVVGGVREGQGKSAYCGGDGVYMPSESTNVSSTAG